MSDRDDSKTPTPEDRADKVYSKTGNAPAWRDPYDPDICKAAVMPTFADLRGHFALDYPAVVAETRKMRGDMDADQLVALRRKAQWGQLITKHK
jgi:hypothetical protein